MKKPNIPIGKISSENQKIQDRKRFEENWDRIFGKPSFDKVADAIVEEAERQARERECPHQTKDGCEIVDICENDEVDES